MTARKFTAAQDVQLAAEYASGKTFRQIGVIYCASESAVRRAVARGGGVARPQNKEARPDLAAPRKFTTAEEADAVRAEYEDGASLKSLAEKYECTVRTLKGAIERAGGTRRRLGRPSVWTDDSVTQLLLEDYATGRDLQEIANDLGLTREAIRQKLRREGVLPRLPTLMGAAHGSWRGGRIKMSGYVYVRATEADLAYGTPNSGGYVAEHRLILGRILGRPMTPQETVHHINGDRSDNRPENLQLRQGRHGKGALWVCQQCGSHDVKAALI